MPQTPATPPMDPQAVADRWFFELLRRELEYRGMGEAAIRLR